MSERISKPHIIHYTIECVTIKMITSADYVRFEWHTMSSSSTSIKGSNYQIPAVEEKGDEETGNQEVEKIMYALYRKSQIKDDSS